LNLKDHSQFSIRKAYQLVLFGAGIFGRSGQQNKHINALFRHKAEDAAVSSADIARQ
jgi:hypothetical protein